MRPSRQLFRGVARAALLWGAFASTAAARPARPAPPLPAPGGAVVNVSTEGQLQSAVQHLASNTTIVIAPGTYVLSSTLWVNGTFTNIGIRGATDNADDVVLVGPGMAEPNFGGVPFGIWTGGNIQGVTIANLAIRDIYYHPIIFNAGTQSPRVYNVHLLDAGQQFIKSNPDGAGGGVDNGIVEYSVIEFTTTAKDSYTNGVDVHTGANWIIRHNLFRNIVAPPGQLAGPSVLMWNHSSNTLTDGNVFLNCARGVSYGLAVAGTDHSGGIIRNNYFYRSSGQPGDVGILVADSPNTQVLNNTVFVSGTYGTPIEYRFPGSSGIQVSNNITDGAIWARNGATGTESHNITGAGPALFVNAAAGDLRLAPTAAAAIDQGVTLANVTDDWDGDLRPNGPAFDIGADEFGATTTAFAILGHVLDVHAAGVPGVTVTLGGSLIGTTTTDGFGAYAFPALPTGDYTLTPSKNGYTFTPGQLAYTALAANQTADFGASLTPPAMPTGLAATPGDAQVTLTWTSSTGAATYSVRRATASGGPYVTVAAGILPATYVDSGLSNGTAYYYAVSAVNAAGESALSTEVPATPVPAAAPTGLTVTPGSGQVTLTWTASPGATSYLVKRATTAGGPYTTIASGLLATAYTDVAVAGGASYYYVVSARGGAPRVRVDLAGRIPTTSNPTSPAVAGSQLLLVDQGGYVYRWNGTAAYELLNPSTLPAGINGTGRETVLNVAADATGSLVYVMFTSSTVPAGIPTRTSPRPGADAWQVLYQYAFNGTLLLNPQPITALQVRAAGYTGGGLAVLADGSLLFATGDSGDAFEDGRSYAQDATNHLSKIVRIHPVDGSIDVVALGVRNVQRLAVYPRGSDAGVDFIDIGGNLAEELNSLPLSALLASGAVNNFGWGRSAVDGKAREGAFYIDASGGAAGGAPVPEPGFLQPTAWFGRDGAALVAGSGPVSSTQFPRITSLFGDLVSGSVYAVTGALSLAGQEVVRVSLVDSLLQPVALAGLVGGGRPDPRFFNFADGAAGVLLEASGNFYRLTELPWNAVESANSVEASAALVPHLTIVGGSPQGTSVGTVFGTPLQVSVLDLANNPVIGASVTFMAPAGSATATFAGMTTTTVLTGAGGIAVAPALTANSVVGGYGVSASLDGAGIPPVTFSLTNTPAGVPASLAGVASSATTNVNLTAEGTSDWVHWGESTLNRKTAIPQIGTYTVVGGGPAFRYANDLRQMTWADGTPTASSTANANGLYINGTNNGFAILAPADPLTRTLVVHVGGWASGGRLTAHLSDGSAVDYVDTTATAAGQYDRNYTLTYAAAASGQTLRITWIMSSGGGNVTLNGAALAVANLSLPTLAVTGGTPQSALVNTPFSSGLQVTVLNGSGQPLSGATVTFTAPPGSGASGASASFSGSATTTSVTNASGIASTVAPTANGVAGSYTVSASVNGFAVVPVTFALANTALPTLAISGGVPQSALVNTAFGGGLQVTVLNGSGQPLSGATVTFTAPASGASASFGASATTTSVTNASGIASTVAPTANGVPGTYSVSASLNGFAVAPVAFSLTNTAPVQQPTLVGSVTSGVAAVNLTTEGASDWVHWGDATLSRKAAPAQLSTYTQVGNSGAARYSNDLRPISWTDGAPTASSATNRNGLYISGRNNGFSILAPADPTLRTLVVHVGGWASSGTLTAHLSDGSTADFTDTTAAAASQYDRNYTLTYASLSTGQTLRVTWVMASTGGGNVTLNAAALAVAGASVPSSTITATGGTPQSAVVTTAFASGLSATVLNGSSQPLSGVTVTFTAPASGASASFGGATTTTAVTNASGVATVAAPTANGGGGSYAVTATAAGVPGSALFTLTNTLPSTMAATGGTPQSAVVTTVFASGLSATVLNGSSQPLSGVTVTFTAPASGASASFGGAATTTAVTNASGIATVAAPTANGVGGSYAVTATAAGVPGSALFTLTNTASAPQAVLTGAVTSAATNVNLTAEGAVDWVHWGETTLSRKAVAAQLGNYTVVGAGAVSRYPNDLRTMSWSDGTPTVSSSTNRNGVYISGLNNGFSILAPADATVRTLTIHVGGWASSGRLTAHLSDGSAVDFVNASAFTSGQYDRNYTLTYSALSAGQTLRVSWVMASTGGGNVTLNAAALSLP